MALKIRLRQQGCKNHRTYRLVVIDSRQARDGQYVEALGWYNPRAAKVDQELSINANRVRHWIACGAQMSEKAHALVKRAAPEAVACGCHSSCMGK